MPRDLKILTIGRNSFLGSIFSPEAVSHADSQLDALIERADVIVNFSFHPDFFLEEYDERKDFDTTLAQKIRHGGQKLVVMSSRAVYGRFEDVPFREDMPLFPVTAYGRNKKNVEESCSGILGQRLLVLRPSNIFGFEYGSPERRTFMSRLLGALKTEGRMTFDVSPGSFKDFLPVLDFCRVVKDILNQNVSGVYNVGSGRGIPLKKLANSLALGYGKCSIDYTGSAVDSFALDVTKLRGLGITLPTEDEILKSFEDTGRRLAAA